jgi:hypothetical protein
MMAIRRLSGVRRVAFVFALLLAASLVPPGIAAQDQQPPVAAAAPTVDGPPSGALEAAAMEGDWWSMVQEQIRQSEYHITWQEETTLSGLAAAYQAPNRAQNLRTYFAPRGPIVVPRTWAQETAGPLWRWEMHLSGWGRAGAIATPPAAVLDVQENRMAYRRGGPSLEPGLVETYRNEEDGLMQGFTILARPGAGQAEGPFQLHLELGGNLTAEMVSEAAEIAVRTADGRDALRYGGLWAEDASGEPLSAGLSLEGETLTLWVEDAAATYPIQVEARITGLPPDEEWWLTFGQEGAGFGPSEDHSENLAPLR